MIRTSAYPLPMQPGDALTTIRIGVEIDTSQLPQLQDDQVHARLDELGIAR